LDDFSRITLAHTVGQLSWPQHNFPVGNTSRSCRSNRSFYYCKTIKI